MYIVFGVYMNKLGLKEAFEVVLIVFDIQGHILFVVFENGGHRVTFCVVLGGLCCLRAAAFCVLKWRGGGLLCPQIGRAHV